MRILAVMALGLALAAPSAHAQKTTPPPIVSERDVQAKGAKRLAAADVPARYIGNTLSGITSDGDPFHVFVVDATTYRMQFQGKKTNDKWHVDASGAFCSIDGTDTTCTREYADGKTIYSFNLDGTHAGTAELRPGNPEKL